MNAKEELIETLKRWVVYFEDYNKLYPYSSKEYSNKKIQYYTDLIAATEAAIFDVPTEDEIGEATAMNNSSNISNAFRAGFEAGCNFILNYKTESDGK